jgi:uncharacterized membrane protein
MLKKSAITMFSLSSRLSPPAQAGETPAPPVLWAHRIASAFLHHWLALVLTALLVFGLGPFLAPVAMAAGWTAVGKALYAIYSPFCHQLPQRSWFLFGEQLTYTLDEIYQVYPYTDAWRLRQFYGTADMGWKVAWSDRMISFYTMTPIFGLLYAALRRRLRPLSWQLLVLALMPLFLDGVSHVANDLFYGVAGGGFRDTNSWLAFLTGDAWPGFYAGDHVGTFNWWMRLVTGMLAAWGLAFWAFPWLDQWMRTEFLRRPD